MIHRVLLRVHPPCRSAEFDERIVATLREECATFFSVVDDFANCGFCGRFVGWNVTQSDGEENWMRLFEKSLGDGAMILLDLFNDRLETPDGFRLVFDFHFQIPTPVVGLHRLDCGNFAGIVDRVDHCLFLLFVVDEHFADGFELVETFGQVLFGLQKFAVLGQVGSRTNETRVRDPTHFPVEIARSERCGRRVLNMRDGVFQVIFGFRAHTFNEFMNCLDVFLEFLRSVDSSGKRISGSSGCSSSSTSSGHCVCLSAVP